MSKSDAIEKIKGIIIGLLQKMGLEADLEVREQTETVVFNIRTDDSHMLIGKHGVNLYALQYIVRVFARRTVSEELDFLIDVDDYKRKREATLENLAEEARTMALDKNKAVALKSMPAHERRIIHAKLSLYDDVTTNSVGEEPERLVVVCPKGTALATNLTSLPFSENEDYKILD